jgi:Cu/Zn superoxide dismutase
MSSSSYVDSSASTASSTSEATDTQAVECRACGKQFDDMAEMQRHMLTEHIQKGDLPMMNIRIIK